MFGLRASNFARHQRLGPYRLALNLARPYSPCFARFLVLETPRSVVRSQIPRHVFSRPLTTQSPPKPSILSRISFPTLQASPGTGSSLGKVIALAKPEKKPLTLALCLLLVSSSVAMSVPFTIGKLIDFFSTNDPVSKPRVWCLELCMFTYFG
jgi:hypothetical protein